MKKKSRLFLSYAVSYIIIFFLPVVILSTLVYLNSYLNMRREQQIYSQTVLDKIQISMDQVINELNSVSFDISGSYRFLPSNALKDNTSKGEVIAYLATANLQNDFFTNICMSYQSADYVLTPRGVYPRDRYLSEKLGIGGKQLESFCADLNENSSRYFVKTSIVYTYGDSSTEKTKILYICPVMDYRIGVYAQIIYEINPFRFSESVLGLSRINDGSLYVLNRQGDRLLQQEAAGVSFEEMLRRADLSEPFTAKEINGFWVSCLQSSGQELSYVMVSPHVSLANVFWNSNIWFFYLLAILLVVGICFTIYFSYKFYNPIQCLATYVRSGISGKPAECINELAYIQARFDEVQNMRLNLARRLDEQWDSLECNVINDLLNHTLPDTGDFFTKTFCEQIEGKHFLVCSVAIEPDMVPDDTPAGFVNRALNLSMDKKGFAFSVYNYHYHAVTALAAFHEKPPENVEETLYYALKQRIAQESAAIGIGNICGHIEDIHASFLESISALEYRKLNPNRQFSACRGELCYSREFDSYQLENLLAMKQCLKNNELDRIRPVVEKMILDIQSADFNGNMIRMICHDIINSLIRFLQENSIGGHDEQIDAIIGIESLHYFQIQITALLEEVCVEMEEASAARRSDLSLRIEKLIDTQFSDPDFNLSALSEVLGLSTSYLSKFISESFQKSFTDIVTKKRMDCVRTLLETSDMPIAQVAQKAGYTNMSNFMKRFKMQEKMTPGQYRSFHNGNGYSNPT